MSQYHILNGDSLNDRFPKEIDGSIIIMRECFIDIPLNGISEKELLHNRPQFLSDRYDEISNHDYEIKTIQELQKIQSIPNNAAIHLWFEDDLFCQANLWFTIRYILKLDLNCNLFLVRPNNNLAYGFAGLTKEGLLKALENRIPITKPVLFQQLWFAYIDGDKEKVAAVAQLLKNDFPFIEAAISAHLERIPTKENPGRPINTIKTIINELNTEQFAPVFKEFCKREAIYGFGDLQVKALMKEINKHQL